MDSLQRCGMRLVVLAVLAGCPEGDCTGHDFGEDALGAGGTGPATGSSLDGTGQFESSVPGGGADTSTGYNQSPPSKPYLLTPPTSGTTGAARCFFVNLSSTEQRFISVTTDVPPMLMGRYGCSVGIGNCTAKNERGYVIRTGGHGDHWDTGIQPAGSFGPSCGLETRPIEWVVATRPGTCALEPESFSNPSTGESFLYYTAYYRYPFPPGPDSCAIPHQELRWQEAAFVPAIKTFYVGRLGAGGYPFSK